MPFAFRLDHISNYEAIFTMLGEVLSVQAPIMEQAGGGFTPVWVGSQASLLVLFVLDTPSNFKIALYQVDLLELRLPGRRDSTPIAALLHRTRHLSKRCKPTWRPVFYTGRCLGPYPSNYSF